MFIQEVLCMHSQGGVAGCQNFAWQLAVNGIVFYGLWEFQGFYPWKHYTCI
jgi:hypothetical protein